MKLYLVVRHRQNPQQLWLNIWQDDVNDEQLTSIETTLEIGNLCNEEKNRNHLVYIHRCGYEDYPPMICCSACVAEVTATDNANRVKILFREQTTLNSPPIIQPVRHQNYYFAPPP